MGFGWGVGEFIALSGLAIRVNAAYKNGPDNCRHISEEVVVLQVLIGKAAEKLKSTNISNYDRHDGQKVLKGCQRVLENLYSVIEKYKRLASMKPLVFTGAKLGNDIVTLQVSLSSNTTLLRGFVRRFVIPISSYCTPFIQWILIFLS